MKPIEIEMHRHDNFVFGRVLNMPDELRATGTIIKNSKFRIDSLGYPSLENDRLCLRGDLKNCDENWFYFSFMNEDRAKVAVNNISILIQRWNEEHRDILDEKEKEYLSEVIKPFKKQVISIRKEVPKGWYGKFESVSICFHSRLAPVHAYINFPFFKAGTMYKGMERFKPYSLKELGLE